mmetsp:Transcript_17628/g.25099  ORF Transcript_17628/g.25099 Transcript_17628/m.25099 type:complete len:255 (-) Transcript_17628:2144-2908(-)
MTHMAQTNAAITATHYCLQPTPPPHFPLPWCPPFSLPGCPPFPLPGCPPFPLPWCPPFPLPWIDGGPLGLRRILFCLSLSRACCSESAATFLWFSLGEVLSRVSSPHFSKTSLPNFLVPLKGEEDSDLIRRPIATSTFPICEPRSSTTFVGGAGRLLLLVNKVFPILSSFESSLKPFMEGSMTCRDVGSFLSASDWLTFAVSGDFPDGLISEQPLAILSARAFARAFPDCEASSADMLLLAGGVGNSSFTSFLQ